MNRIKKNDKRLKHSGYYNIYPIQNEISVAVNTTNNNTSSETDELLLDDYYGRIFESNLYNNVTPYGICDKLNYYPSGISGKIIDTLRVPYRKIPIYDVESLSTISELIKKIELANSEHEILLRGQSKIYTLPREKEELIKLYGSHEIKEPSFLPSHLRNDFDEKFMHSMWHSQASILLNDIGADYSKSLEKEKYQEYQNDVQSIRGGVHLTGFALGIAQHYGMPSVGLDLTKKVEVAAWFATNKMNIAKDGLTTVEEIDSYNDSTIFVFRCPKNSVFPYSNVKPKTFPVGRPDKQDAWFGHVGWGNAKNQLGSYLVCGFRMKKDFLNEIPAKYENQLFPSLKDDPILEYFVKMKSSGKYQGEAKRALDKIYVLKE